MKGSKFGPEKRFDILMKMSKRAPVVVFLLTAILFEQGASDDQTTASTSSSRDDKGRHTGLYSGPYFVENSDFGPKSGSNHKNIDFQGLLRKPPEIMNVTAQVGQTATLPCKVRRLGENMVSWIRNEDAHILTVHDTTYISDSRFFILQDHLDWEKWNLHIRNIHRKDSGIYECQVNTSPKMSRFVRLNVIPSAKVFIEGNSEVHAKAGSTVVFKCHIVGTSQRPAFIFWYKDNARISTTHSSSSTAHSESFSNVEWVTSALVDVEDGHISPEENGEGVFEEKGGGETQIQRQNISIKEQKSLSKFSKQQRQWQMERRHRHPDFRRHFLATLRLAQVKPESGGVYNCTPSNSPSSATVRLHVIENEIRAAVSGGKRAKSEIISSTSLPNCIFLLIIISQIRGSAVFYTFGLPTTFHRLR